MRATIATPHQRAGSRPAQVAVQGIVLSARQRLTGLVILASGYAILVAHGFRLLHDAAPVL